MMKNNNKNILWFKYIILISTLISCTTTVSFETLLLKWSFNSEGELKVSLNGKVVLPFGTIGVEIEKKKEQHLLIKCGPQRHYYLLGKTHIYTITLPNSKKNNTTIVTNYDQKANILVIIPEPIGGIKRHKVLAKKTQQNKRLNKRVKKIDKPFKKKSTSFWHPKWLKKLNINPIAPGIGIAGIKVGDSEESVIRYLGYPSRGPFPAIRQNKSIMHYVLWYEYKDINLLIYTRTKSRTVYTFRLHDKKFGKFGFISSTKEGATIGSTMGFIKRMFGKPQKTIRCGCSASSNFRNKNAYILVYRGISFLICLENNLVYMIDV